MTSAPPRYRLCLESPFGRLRLTGDEKAILRLDWWQAGEAEEETSSPLLEQAARELEAYFSGAAQAFTLPLRPAGTAFQQRVWAAMQAIPYGRTASYGQLARDLGSVPRAVGLACGANPIPIIIPCHRVLARKALGGFSAPGGLVTKQALLRLEGAELPAAKRQATEQLALL